MPDLRPEKSEAHWISRHTYSATSCPWPDGRDQRARCRADRPSAHDRYVDEIAGPDSYRQWRFAVSSRCAEGDQRKRSPTRAAASIVMERRRPILR